MVRTVVWDDESVVLIDQRKLPQEESYLRCRHPAEVAAAIRDMAVRGAPAIGVTAAFGIALGVRLSTAEGEALRRDLEAVCEQMRVTRPTAVNLFWAIERMRRRFAARASRARVCSFSFTSSSSRARCHSSGVTIGGAFMSFLPLDGGRCEGHTVTA